MIEIKHKQKIANMPSTSASEFYDSIGIKYQEAYGHCPDHIDFLSAALELLAPNTTVLDVGCGTGKPTASMIVGSGRKVHGIDFSPKMISICRQQIRGGSFEQADILAYDTETTFDAIMAFYSLLNFSHEQMTCIVANLYKWTKPGGYLFIGTLHPDGFQADPDKPNAEDSNGTRHIRNRFMGSLAPILLYTEPGWRMLLEGAGFEILSTSKATFEPPKESGSETELHMYITARRAVPQSD